MTTAIRIESVSKLYRLGTVGTGTISHDLNRWWHSIRGKEDPYAKVGQINDRTQSSTKNQELSTKNGEAPDYVWALRDINLEVQQGEILGIIGRNGAGKSTLLKLLSRVTAPTTGSIKTKGRIASLLEVGTGFHPEMTGRENIYMNGAILGMRRHEITRQLDEIVEFSGCAKYLDTPTKRYSSGMTVRLGFAVAAHLQCEILIVDEVLAVGDAEFQKKCMQKMNSLGHAGRTVIFVSHNLGAISQLTTSCLVLSSGRVSYLGSTTQALDNYASGLSNSQRLSGDVSNAPRLSWVSQGAISICSATLDPWKDSTLTGIHDLTLELGVASRETMGRYSFGLSIVASDGTLIGSAFTEAFGPITAGQIMYHSVSLRNPGIAPGKYWFLIGLLGTNCEVVDAIDEVLSFEISAPEMLPQGFHEWNSAWGHVRLEAVCH
jgi:lipopolysaccharide transport system ATP-binding protein